MKNALAFALLFASNKVYATETDQATIAAAEAELEALQNIQADTNARIARLDVLLNDIRGNAATAIAASPSRIAGEKLGEPLPQAAPKLDVSGDIRLRYESNFGSKIIADRDRWALRARLRVQYPVTPWLHAGAQITTGDPDDPNSSDVTLSNFNDDLQVSLDKAYLTASNGKLIVSGGKIALPFVKTDLVWDNDVYPQGVSATLAHNINDFVAVKASGLYFVIDESIAGKDSRMIGGQIAAIAKPVASLELGLAASYYDYRLSALAGGDAGDYRSNLFSGGRYLSDFNLVDLIVSASWAGSSKNWPVKITADYVENFGAVVADNDAFSTSVTIGRTGLRGDWRVGYGYAEADVDAVLAAFSNDNTPLATNYYQHNITLDYTLAPHVVLNATLYRYRPKSAIQASTIDINDWSNRIRINLSAEF